MTIPDEKIWKHLHRSNETDAYRGLTDEQRKKYDGYVQACYDDDHKAYFDGRGRRNPDTVAFWAPRIGTLAEWLGNGEPGAPEPYR